MRYVLVPCSMGWNRARDTYLGIAAWGEGRLLLLVPEVVRLFVVLIFHISRASARLQDSFYRLLLVGHQLALSALVAIVRAHAAEEARDPFAGFGGLMAVKAFVDVLESPGQTGFAGLAEELALAVAAGRGIDGIAHDAVAGDVLAGHIVYALPAHGALLVEAEGKARRHFAEVKVF